MKPRYIDNNKGISLVELIVTIAILAIVGAAMVGFLSYCISQYQKSTDETNLQYESQLCFNRLKEQILHTSNGIAVTEGGKQLALFGYDESGAKKQMTTYTLSGDGKRQILYREFFYSDGAWVQEGEAECFASLVSDWQVRIFEKDGKPVQVSIGLQMQAGEKTYEAEERLALRNEIINSTDVDEIYR